ncbi:MAG: 2,3-bisphosphoglycerate-independent phosphoglycerate mutase [Deltaproteobacteria bacterium]|nr:2,3-bisphosphoglycerate-independent phosphoglycerate mutase [Deltaproteobacteria bacterium]
MSKPATLIILDGWGINKNSRGNAIAKAKTPFLDKALEEYPSSELLCSGEAVGLPKSVMGNSEVGHLNIGAGKVVYQDLLRINNSITDGSFKTNSTICELLDKLKKKNSSLHLMGLLSDGGVHSHIKHLFAIIDIAQTYGVTTYIHPILDGRDTPPKSGINYLKELSQYIEDKETVDIATICGRYYAMDRDTRWERVEEAYKLYTEGAGVISNNYDSAIISSYNSDITDEFVKPHVLEIGGLIKDNDGVFFFNYRADRAREITKAFVLDDFNGFKRSRRPNLSGYICMTSYEDMLDTPVAFPPVKLKGILGEAVSQAGLNQFRLAETEKYAHVTYFFNGGEEQPFENEERCLVASPRDISTYDQKPEMSAVEVKDKAIERLKLKKDALTVINFANMDMVGHTGIIDAAVTACETVDQCVKEVVEAALANGNNVFLTADHGNAEEMIAESGSPHTAHTLNPVPFVFISKDKKNLKDGALCDIAPTILDLMGLEKPKEMDGSSLFVG